jgi:hypothetical protein
VTTVIRLCDCDPLCMKNATHRITLSRGAKKAPPIYACDTHTAEIREKLKAESDIESKFENVNQAS